MKVRLFARLRELAAADCIEIDMPPGGTVRDLRGRIGERYPAMRALLERCAVAVAEEFAADDLVLSDHAEVALLPPVSGG
jgi:molybdopterin converting factor subunit 1